MQRLELDGVHSGLVLVVLMIPKQDVQCISDVCYSSLSFSPSSSLLFLLLHHLLHHIYKIFIKYIYRLSTHPPPLTLLVKSQLLELQVRSAPSNLTAQLVAIEPAPEGDRY